MNKVKKDEALVLLNEYNKSRQTEEGFKPIHSNALITLFGKNYKSLLSSLEKEGAVEINHFYELGKKTKQYNVKSPVPSIYRSNHLKQDKIKARLELAFERGNKCLSNFRSDPVFDLPFNPYCEWGDTNIEQKAVKQTLDYDYNRKILRQNDVLLTSASYNIEKGDFNNSSRTYSFFNNLKKVVKRKLKMKGESDWENTLEVDLKSAHPQIVCHLMFQEGFINEKEHKVLYSKIINKQFQKDIVNAFRQIKFKEDKEFLAKEDKELFLIAWGSLVNFKFLTSTLNQNSKKKALWAPVFDCLNNLYPKVYDFILKEQKDYKEELLRGMQNPLTLQGRITRVEQKIVRKVEWLLLKEKGVLTINEHDGLLIPQSLKDYCQCVFIDVINEMFGLSLSEDPTSVKQTNTTTIKTFKDINVNIKNYMNSNVTYSNKSNKYQTTNNHSNTSIVLPSSNSNSKSKLDCLDLDYVRHKLVQKETENLQYSIELERQNRLEQTRQFANTHNYIPKPIKPSLTPLQQEELQYQKKLAQLNNKPFDEEDFINKLIKEQKQKELKELSKRFEDL